MTSHRFLAVFALLTLGLSPLPALADGGGEPGHAAGVSDPAPPTNNLRALIEPVKEPAAGCAFSDMIGKTPETVDKTRFGDRHVRTLKYDQMVTMEFMENRINLLVDEKGVIIQVTCG